MEYRWKEIYVSWNLELGNKYFRKECFLFKYLKKKFLNFLIDRSLIDIDNKNFKLVWKFVWYLVI